MKRLTLIASILFLAYSSITLAALTEAQYYSTLTRVAKVFTPIATTQGATLKIINEWKSYRFNAYAEREKNEWRLGIYGGYARHKLMTEDGLTMAACHELGHFMGGEPRYSDKLSYEGQSDYWAGLECFKKVVEKDNNVAFVSKIVFRSTYAKEICEEHNSTPEGAAICERAAMAALSFMNVTADCNMEKKVSLNSSDWTEARGIFDNYPSAQCRLDTFFAGAANAPRPRCWYNP